MTRRLLSVATALLVAAGIAVGLQRTGSSQSAQEWSDFDAPPWSAGIKVGTTYEYSVHAHCGVDGATIDGTAWRAETPIPDGRDVPGWNNIGKLRIESADRALFENEKYRVVFLRDDLPPGPPCA